MKAVLKSRIMTLIPPIKAVPTEMKRLRGWEVIST